MDERIPISNCPVCGGELRAVETREVYLNIHSMVLDPECGNLDFTGDGEEYKETDYTIEGRQVYCANGHEEPLIRNRLESLG